MKKRLALFLAIAAAVSFFALRPKTSGRALDSASDRARLFAELKPQTVTAVAAGVSPKISSFKETDPKPAPAAAAVRFVSENQIARNPDEAAAARTEEPVLGRTSAAPMPTPSLSFDGLTNRDNGEVFGLYFLPPDPNGDVGPNHYVQAVNTLLRIYDKTGSPLTPRFKMSDIFAPLGTVCAQRNDGEAVVLYDPLADRWLLTQYCNAFPPFRQMIAVSQTGDPLGAYYIYEFVMPNVRLNDYAKFGVWPDGYYMSDDEFVGSDYAGAGLFAFDRQKILTGDPTASYVYFNIPSASPLRTGGLLPADLDGLTPPPPGVPNVFAGYTATEYGAAQDAVRLFDFHADFRNPENSTFTERPESPLAVAPFDPTSPDGRADIAQPAPGDFLDSQSDRLMYRVAYRNFGTHESLVFNQTVRITPVGQTYRAGVRVYELRRANGAFAVTEQTTFGEPLSSRWMGAAAADHQGNIAFEYSFVNDQKNPSILYSGRLATEPAGVFRSEETLVAGTGVQTAFGYRWGNFSGLTVDPVDDCTFWTTNQYFSAESQAESPFSWLTRIGRFRFAECVNAPRATISGTVTDASNNAPLGGALVTANAVYSRATGATGSYGSLMVLPNTYTITATAKGYRPQTVTVTVADGQSLTRNFALAPSAALEGAGTSVTAESCAPNQTIEPNETVTLNVALRNTGSRGTTALSATLLATGGVVNPSGPQNYGALAAGGASAARPFTFTVSPNVNCGGTVTLTLRLSDGADDLGTVSIEIRTGRKRIAFTENFDAPAAPELPAGWTTSATGAQQNWTTSTIQVQSPPNSVFSPDPNQVGVNELVSPAFPVASAGAELSFRNWYELETTFLRNRLYDGSVLDIKIGNNDWQDIEAAGGAFLAGGYDGVIDACCQNPLAGRRGWSGRSGINQTSEFITSRVRLPAAAAGQNVQLRWRIGTDIGTFRTGQFIDDLVVTDGDVCSCQNSQAFRAPFDFDGDGRTDLGVFRPSDTPDQPDFLVEASANGAPRNGVWGSVGDVAAASDYDGDGRTDFAVFRPADRNWYILQSSNNAVAVVNFGLAADRLAPADYDGDGKTDIAVFRPSSGVWYVLQSGSGQVRIQQFGLSEDLPVAADYDGDAKADVAVWRPSTGTWYAFRSTDNAVTIVNFGLAGDRPVAGDYDGDGRADFVVWRPSDRNWYLLQSAQGFGVVNFGLATDKPLQADFDGDGRRDIAVWRPAAGVWYYLRSADGGFFSRGFGAPGDTAIPSIFVP
ncbi:MAG: VCBS repeat-containing protein [Acidobacteria bacterium]|nr:VCBS repeat-containing protein [Acidobacteriota bacterium]